MVFLQEAGAIYDRESVVESEDYRQLLSYKSPRQE